MRTIELLAALMGALGLGACAYLSSRSARLAIATLVASLAVLAANLALAETRLSLAAAGLGAAALIAFGALFLARGKGRRRGSVLACATIEGALLISAFVFPIFSPIPPEGRFEVGKIGPFAIEEATSLDGGRRRILVDLYYPSDEVIAFPRSRYLDGEGLFRAFGLPGFMGRYLRLARANSHDGAPISESERSYPLVLFSHGIGDFPEEYAELLEGLASEGFIVAAINHAGYSRFARMPGGEVLYYAGQAVEAAMGRADKGKSETILRALEVLSDDQSRTIDWLLQRRDEGGPFSRIDSAAIAAVGHSFGGAAAVLSLRRDGRLRVGVDLDGPLYGESLAGVARPLLVLSSDKASYLEAGSASANPRAAAIVRHYFDGIEACERASRPRPALATILGSSHSSFGGLSSHSPFKYFDEYPATRDSRETIRIARELTAAFLADSLGAPASPSRFDLRSWRDSGVIDGSAVHP
jgi:Predicted dienelactone hydrolase